MAESILLRPHDPAWAVKFESERKELLSQFQNQFLAIEHIGSTAIPGISAKPIIDILGGVESMEVADKLIPRLLNRGWDTSAEFNRTIGDRRFLLKWPEGVRTHHLHLVIFKGPYWHPSIVFRDRLKVDLQLRAEYESLKEELALQFPNDREAYTKAKECFIRKVVEGEGVPYQGS
jgi:GrpB-like predicted nucleotidyltransferase (UPF0157 family)